MFIVFLVVKRKYKVREKREQKKKFKKKRALANVASKPLLPVPTPAAAPADLKPDQIEPIIDSCTTADVKRYVYYARDIINRFSLNNQLVV